MKTELDTREQRRTGAGRRKPGQPAADLPPAARRAASASRARRAARDAQPAQGTGFQPARPGGRRLRAAPSPPATRPAPAPRSATGTATLEPPVTRPATPRPGPRPQRTAGPQRPAGPDPQRPVGAAAGGRTDAADRPAAARKLSGVPRTPFVLLVLGLLGGGLVCLLVINSTLATASYQINNLQQQNTQLAQQEQELQQQIATEKAPGSIAHRAYQLGMRPQGHLTFLNAKTGRIYRQPHRLASVPNAAGYTP